MVALVAALHFSRSIASTTQRPGGDSFLLPLQSSSYLLSVTLEHVHLCPSVLLTAGRPNTACNWERNCNLQADQCLQEFLTITDPFRLGAADETDLNNGQKKWAGLRARVTTTFETSDAVSKKRKAEGKEVQLPPVYEGGPRCNIQA
jgi:hypothetical protein